MAALEELCEAVHDLPAAGADNVEHVNLLERLKARVQLASKWEASATELLGESTPIATFEQLQVPQPCPSTSTTACHA